LLAFFLLPCSVAAQQPFFDRTHPSQVFGEARNYRIFWPPDYASSKQAYPVIYYCHGHSDRYRLERYDEGKDTVPKIAAFVATHPVIVVAVDGYVARDYTVRLFPAVRQNAIAQTRGTVSHGHLFRFER
jgi:poly(3-hydroxybutyrate) depolymerase